MHTLLPPAIDVYSYKIIGLLLSSIPTRVKNSIEKFYMHIFKTITSSNTDDTKFAQVTAKQVKLMSQVRTHEVIFRTVDYSFIIMGGFWLGFGLWAMGVGELKFRSIVL